MTDRTRQQGAIMWNRRLQRALAASAIASGAGVAAPGIAAASISTPAWVGSPIWNFLRALSVGSAEFATGSAAPLVAFLQGG